MGYLLHLCVPCWPGLPPRIVRLRFVVTSDICNVSYVIKCCRKVVFLLKRKGSVCVCVATNKKHCSTIWLFVSSFHNMVHHNDTISEELRRLTNYNIKAFTFTLILNIPGCKQLCSQMWESLMFTLLALC